METVLVAILGLVVVLVAMVDALWTALWATRATGPLSGRLADGVWRLYARFAPRRDWVLSLAGPSALVTVVGAWVLLLWIGWTGFFSADGGIVVHASSGEPATLGDRIYFVGYTLFTMGNGDFSPRGTLPQIATALCAGSGMLLVTLAVTFLLSVVSAAANKRALASQISGLGTTPEQFVTRAWGEGDFPALDHYLLALASSLGQVTEQHLAYPILHYYHPGQDSKAAPTSIATLDEALTLLEHGVHPDVRPAAVALVATRAAVSHYLATLQSAFIASADALPPSPDLASLRRAGIPTADEGEYLDALASMAERRRVLLGMVRHGAQRWPGT